MLVKVTTEQLAEDGPQRAGTTAQSQSEHMVHLFRNVSLFPSLEDALVERSCINRVGQAHVHLSEKVSHQAQGLHIQDRISNSSLLLQLEQGSTQDGSDGEEHLQQCIPEARVARVGQASWQKRTFCSHQLSNAHALRTTLSQGLLQGLLLRHSPRIRCWINECSMVGAPGSFLSTLLKGLLKRSFLLIFKFLLQEGAVPCIHRQ
mmetsp:Transcript_12278/g.27883  ORF Transcript_12278/g.27883 Transcript_12278/m.27883 type:complete len:205 (-) Transcript_12278:149-763(-)